MLNMVEKQNKAFEDMTNKIVQKSLKKRRTSRFGSVETSFESQVNVNKSIDSNIFG